MKWRAIDNVAASGCIQRIQKLIDSGELSAKDILPMLGEERAKEAFNAWRVYFIDRMMEEYKTQGWSGFPNAQELEYDIEYYNELVRKEKAGLKK